MLSTYMIHKILKYESNSVNIVPQQKIITKN